MNPILTLKDGWNEMVMAVWPILEDASRRGIPVDKKEMDDFIVYLETTRKSIYESIQGKIPDEMRGMYPKNGYVRIPKLVKELWEVYFDKVSKIVLGEGRRLVTLEEFIAKKSYKAILKKGEATNTWGRYRYGLFDITKKNGDLERVGRWCLIKDFNPNSSKQLIRYMKFKKHKVPVKLTGEETSDAKELERLAISTGDLFYDEVIEYRQVSKMLTNDCPNWSPDVKTGAVHTQFGFLPASGQLNSRNPNVQNANKHKPLGKRFRRIVRARDSGGWARGGLSNGGMGLSKRRRILIELDYSGFHAIMLGREAKSERYINISRSDAHSWFTSYVIGKPVEYPKDFNTNEIARRHFINLLKGIKQEYKVIRDTQSKPTILGVGLGLGPKKMYWMNRPRFDKKLNQMVGIQSEARSKQLQGILKELLPELFEYQSFIREVAFRQTYLINLWGMIRWFFDVRGEDGEKAVAFNVQGNAHGMLRWVMRRLNEEILYNVDPMDYFGTNNNNIVHIVNNERINIDDIQYTNFNRREVSALDRFGFINTIHDSLIFEPWEDEVELCIRDVSRVMTTPCKVLADAKVCPDGLVVDVEATYGRNWGSYDERDNPDGMRVWET